MAPYFAMNEPRSHDDRATIARLSWFLVFLNPSLDEDRVVAHDRASDEDLTLHPSPGEPSIGRFDSLV